MSLTKDQIKTALENTTGSNPNLFISTHACAPDFLQDYFENYGLTPERLAMAKKDAIVMHPGPINRGVEIDSSVADGKQSVILQQVTNGIAVRMAAMEILAGKS